MLRKRRALEPVRVLVLAQQQVAQLPTHHRREVAARISRGGPIRHVRGGARVAEHAHEVLGRQHATEGHTAVGVVLAAVLAAGHPIEHILGIIGGPVLAAAAHRVEWEIDVGEANDLVGGGRGRRGRCATRRLALVASAAPGVGLEASPHLLRVADRLLQQGEELLLLLGHNLAVGGQLVGNQRRHL